MQKYRLVPHPDFPPLAVTGVEVSLTRHDGRHWSLDYVVDGTGELVVPDPAAPARTDELWKHTCFELFVAGDAGYVEFNLSPSTRWAAYRFDGYRKGGRDLPLDSEPQVTRRADGLGAQLLLPALSGVNWRVALTSVIEETGGRISYWSLAHPRSKPDFHDPACFVLQLPAAG
ncbi:MAG: DOMON-like domain-containing protein [Sphingomonas sp.]